ncbi:metalloprotease 1 [Microdochium trichocladiopsis]|uniref:Metalloprotease 1 n=1 Tax=Microdochium trichocladiopsis TaxID=1682393 RepID=A0A9P8XYS4_9PEZI|nr:metalloprotease 1 [Microdochium trichocladiopsis]KAH7025025.1 metalloprotease 1 [Microdochium trichocladiopsis]
MSAQEAAEADDLTAQAAAPNRNITVPLYFHIIAASDSAADGYVPQSLVNAQLKAMSDAYNPQGVFFDYKGAEWTINTTWAAGEDEHGMGVKLRKGGYNALNMYFLASLPDNLLGYCYFPVTPKPLPGSNNFIVDGCRLVSWTMPGGSPGGPYNAGATAVHEAGHWFGLMHPFEGASCTGRNDYVKDTPIQSTPSFGCPVNKDSCPGKIGVDNIRNFMDYSDDTCYTGFTKGQRKRLRKIWKAFRK